MKQLNLGGILVTGGIFGLLGVVVAMAIRRNKALEMCQSRCECHKGVYQVCR